jgi:hypothetical protein
MTAVMLNGNLNGNVSKLPAHWQRQTVQQFFGAFNWDDHSLKVQALKLTPALGQGSNQPLSLTLKVQEFFAAVNWDGNAIAAFPTLERLASKSAADDLTLDNFSDLF